MTKNAKHYVLRLLWMSFADDYFVLCLAFTMHFVP